MYRFHVIEWLGKQSQETAFPTLAPIHRFYAEVELTRH